MSVETLHKAQTNAGRAIGLPEGAITGIIDAQKPRIVSLGDLAIETDEGSIREVPAARGISGPDDGSIDKGGSRITNIDPEGDLEALPEDMVAKNAQADLRDANGDPVNGGKLVFKGDPNSFSHKEKIRLFAAAAAGMRRAKIAGYKRSIPAGDMGTNHSDYMDAFARNNMEADDENSKYWQASITGKSAGKNEDGLDMGGLEFRPHATGFGVYLSINEQRKELNIYGRPALLTFSGAGNVSGYAGLYASEHYEGGRPAFSIRGYSDTGGTLSVANPDSGYGIVVTDEVLQIMDNANFAHDQRFTQYKGDKIAALYDLLHRTQPSLKLELHPDPNHIMEVPSDIFVPASVRNLITDKTAKTLNARAVNEAGNDTVTQKGSEILLERGILFIPGTIANAEGVCTSMDEYRHNVWSVERGTAPLDFETAQAMSQQRALARLLRMQQMGELLGTKDYQLAACALGMANMALRFGVAIDPAVHAIVRSDELALKVG